MRIEEMTTARLRKASHEELVDLRRRCINLWIKGKFDKGAETFGVLKRSELLSRFTKLSREMRLRRSEPKTITAIDKIVIDRVNRGTMLGIDVPALGEIVLVEDAVSIVGEYVRDPRRAADIDVIIKCGPVVPGYIPETVLNARIYAEVQKNTCYVYKSDRVEVVHIPLYDLVLRPKDSTVKVTPKVEKVVEKKLSNAEQAEYDAESERIRESQKTGRAKSRHKFQAAQWTFPNGHPRCKICGNEERDGGICLGYVAKIGTSESGNWGHEGVPGQRGGSAPGGGSGEDGVSPAIRPLVNEVKSQLDGVDPELFSEAHVVGSWAKQQPDQLPDRGGEGTSDLDIILVAAPPKEGASWKDKFQLRDKRNETVRRIESKLRSMTGRAIEIRESDIVGTDKTIPIWGGQVGKSVSKEGTSTSGNWGHDGVEGQRGGSAPGGSSSGGRTTPEQKEAAVKQWNVCNYDIRAAAGIHPESIEDRSEEEKERLRENVKAVEDIFDEGVESDPVILARDISRGIRLEEETIQGLQELKPGDSLAPDKWIASYSTSVPVAHSYAGIGEVEPDDRYQSVLITVKGGREPGREMMGSRSDSEVMLDSRSREFKIVSVTVKMDRDTGSKWTHLVLKDPKGKG